jgi:hypothetical protein
MPVSWFRDPGFFAIRVSSQVLLGFHTSDPIASLLPHRSASPAAPLSCLRRFFAVSLHFSPSLASHGVQIEGVVEKSAHLRRVERKRP